VGLYLSSLLSQPMKQWGLNAHPRIINKIKEEQKNKFKDYG
jgi:hypothetical protein